MVGLVYQIAWSFFGHGNGGAGGSERHQAAGASKGGFGCDLASEEPQRWEVDGDTSHANFEQAEEVDLGSHDCYMVLASCSTDITDNVGNFIYALT